MHMPTYRPKYTAARQYYFLYIREEPQKIGVCIVRYLHHTGVERSCQVAEPITETLARFPLDHRVPVPKPVLKQSIIDRETFLLREKLRDPSIDSRMVAKIVQNLSEKDINDLADYALRKARNPGRAFVKLCSNTMKYKRFNP